ncbi:unnamed protein product [Fusarium venenatum]|uniref:Heterokaryon incompatibility domain-containing protein n=2 Tax=Fusarium venenatum TaxID=56646 RepID=A0A2L2U1R1_9HYPO|nr:uncharacterized protein FVRRES_08182 [Fusarium venenatum]CEI68105.1 unnamed protein product [Fusarium venenatum]
MCDNDNDSNVTMGKISRDHGKSIVELLLGIQKSQIEQKKFLPFVKNLECLALNKYPRTHLSRQTINAFNNPKYVALSYTWDASEYEDPTSGGYQVQTADENMKTVQPSKVRDCIFDRITKYMRQSRIELLWIDQHSLQQAICERARCDHIECYRNRQGIETIDLVYKLSSHPVALLTTRIKFVSDLKILVRILRGDLVKYNKSKFSFQLSGKTHLQEARRALRLLRRLTEDSWWKRGWIFQEGYRAGWGLRLLVPHSSNLQRYKVSYGATIFDDIPDELCIDATEFSYEATRLCLAFKAMDSLPPEDRQAISRILETAERYTLLLEKNISMSPTIFAGISKRNLKRHWDQLAIAANCCQYSTRLDVERLSDKRNSFSLSRLALFLLNGELLCNDSLVQHASRMKVLDFIASQSFKRFSAPWNHPSLSFNKGCRLTHVKLTRHGILTKGHLWRLGETIHASSIKRRSSWVDDPNGILDLPIRKLLTQLANTLEDLRHGLAIDIRNYLDRDAASAGYPDYRDNFTAFYMRQMAAELADAIHLGKTLRLASKWEPSRRRPRYRAIFICQDEMYEGLKTNRLGGRCRVPLDKSSLAFTAFSARRQNTTKYGANDLDRHVSLEVNLVDSVNGTKPSPPCLKLKSWIHGLCFFENVERTQVLLPWPPGFEQITD